MELTKLQQHQFLNYLLLVFTFVKEHLQLLLELMYYIIPIRKYS